MFDLENEIQQWMKGLRSNPGFEDGDVEEIEVHIRDSIESELDHGLSQEEAFKKATSSFGRLEEMGDELIKSRTSNLTLPKRDLLAHSYRKSNNPITAGFILSSNYLKLALRTIRRNKGISFINLFGMSVGFASIIIISNWTHYEFSFDGFNKNKERIYRVIEKQEFQGQDVKYLSSMPEWLTGTFEEEIPGIMASTGLLNIGNTWFGGKDTLFEAKNVTYTDDNIFRIFSLNFVYGDPGTALQEPYSMVLSKSFSNKIFDDISPIGKTIMYQNKYQYKVTGVIEDIPGNSHFQADVLLSMKERMPYWDQENYDHTTSIYLLLADNTDPSSLSAPLQQFKKIHLPANSKFIEIQIQPLSDIHLYSKHTIWGQNYKKSDISLVIVLLSVGFLVIVISTINYINLSIALINKRFLEFGIKKMAGSSRSSIIVQYFFESLIFLFIAFLLSILIVEISNPALIAFDILDNSSYIYHQFWFYPVAIGFIAFLSFLISIYPAYILISTKVLSLLEKKREVAAHGFPPGRILTVIQLAISCTLIIYVGYMLKQINYMQKKDLGYAREAIINFQAGDNFASNFETIKTDLLAHANIIDVTSSNITLGRSMWRNCIHFEGESEDDQWITPYMIVDYNFIDFYQIRVVEGRAFNLDYALDRSNKAFIVNESLANAIGRENIIGRRFRTCASDWGEIVGVVQDFNYNSLHHNVEPLAIQLGTYYKIAISVKVRPDNMKASIALLNNTWDRYQPDQPFQYSFLDEKLKNLYMSEQRLVKIHSIFSFISILLSCIGILGVFISATELRTKEIGIRKVHGGSSLNILGLLARGVSGNVALGIILAVPLAWIAIDQWRKNYAYATGISWWIFVLTGIIVLLLAWITVSLTAVKASRRNPVEALRYE